MEEELRALLVTDPALAALVARRIHWLQRPQAGALPAVTLTRVSGRRLVDTEGLSGLTESRVQIDCWGATYAETKAVARAVVARLAGHRFPNLATPILGVFLDAERDSFEGHEPDSITRTMLDILVWHA